MAKVAIIGGGVAGVSSALILGQLGIEITLFEANSSLVSGPPFCHLHAGGNLYPDITDKERVQLLKESIEFAQYYTFCIDKRPTVIAYPKRFSQKVQDFLPTLDMLTNEYKKLVELNREDAILGDWQEYYKLYSKTELEELAKQEPKQSPKNNNEWLIPFAKYTNLDTLQYPVIVVQEYGLNMFKLSAGAELILNNIRNIKLNLNTKVNSIEKKEGKYSLTYSNQKVKQTEELDFLINAAGFKSGYIDDMLGMYKERMVEFKAAYITNWECNIKFPEIIFHGERGSSEGMAQFTPYPANYFQLHGMSKDITLYQNGLAKTTPKSAQPKLEQSFIEKIERGWSQSELEHRTKKAIAHMGFFIPKFAKEAKVAAKPLYGAQQIPGCNISLRGAEVEFVGNYARCEIVKVSSAITMAKEIAKELKNLNLTQKEFTKNVSHLENINENRLTKLSEKIAQERAYPKEVADVVIPIPNQTTP